VNGSPEDNLPQSGAAKEEVRAKTGTPFEIAPKR